MSKQGYSYGEYLAWLERKSQGANAYAATEKARAAIAKATNTERAAAPELLAALKALMAVEFPSGCLTSAMVEASHKASAAIAKAEGE